MSVRKYLLLLSIIVVLFCMDSVAQTSKTKTKGELTYKSALELFKKREYDKALQLLQKAEEYQPDYPEIYFLQADIFYRQNKEEAEVAAIQKGLQRDSLKFSAYYFILGEHYFKRGDYREAQRSYEHYLEKDKRLKNREKAQRQLENCNFAIHALETQQKQEVEVFISSDSSNVYWPSLDIARETILYTTLVDGVENIMMRKEGRDILLNINTEFNEGTQSMTADGQLLYFTGCNLPDTKGRCDIYYAYRISDTLWSDPINLGEPINTEDWEAQPSISADGTKLFFASNRPGGKGKSDIWFSRLLFKGENGRQYWSEPMNLYFNTPEDEMAPFLYYDGRELFFSSAGYPGMGGMDIYKVNLDSVNEPQNIGITVNTHANELGIAIDASGKKGYFASEKSGKIDVYSYTLEEAVACREMAYMYLNVVDATGNVLRPDKLLVQSYTTHDTLAFYSQSYSNSRMLACTPSNNDILISVLKKGYLLYSDTLNSGVATYEEPMCKTIVLEEIAEGKTVILKGVFFDVDEYVLKEESEEELKQLVEFLKANPDVRIEVSGHTDGTGTEEHNSVLSENRAYEVYKYLFMQYIKKDRMEFKGYGSKQPIDSNLTEEGRRKNRRTEVRIIM